MRIKKTIDYSIETIGAPLFNNLDEKEYDILVSTLLFSIKEYLMEDEKKPP